MSANTALVQQTAEASAHGGGIFFTGAKIPSIRHSTIVDNRDRFLTNAESVGRGPGVFAFQIEIGDSIIAQNFVDGATPAAEGEVAATTIFSLGYNLVGVDESGAFAGVSDHTGQQSSPLDPLLGSLAENGGPTKTHAPLPGSPAIDSGNPDFIPEAYSPPLILDQRGLPRVADGNGDGSARIDRGAVEVASPSPLIGDLNRDGVVGLADLIVLRNRMNIADLGDDADLNGDGEVNRGDVIVLLANYGQSTVPTETPPAAIVAMAAPNQSRRSANVLAARTRLAAAAVDRSISQVEATDLRAGRTARRHTACSASK